ncbi:polysaccharide deacetylase family protein [Halovivax sp.]|uniref:polysaccharide deacetylase family protein n=1 Tax=Halovivax sp. TaxID=1935978 RepID=UPI0025C51351|nr:polysaccharide deacetylase family protein [Halovivax sp.]
MGSVVISLDAELGWGFHDLPEPPRDRVEGARRGWETTLDVLDDHDVPATWAIVGHLMLERCDREHADHPAPRDWFQRERGEWRDRPDLRFGPDLVSAVRESPVAHEIGSHSFSHVLFGDPDTPEVLARAECQRARDITADWGFSPDSFVFPRNEVGHLDALAESGFRVYRGRTSLPEGAPRVLETIAREPSLLVDPSIDDRGLVNLPASVFCFGFEGPLRTVAETVWTDPMVALAHLGIDQAAANDGVFHIWWHPNNVTTDRDERRIRRIVEYVARRRADADLRVETMGDVARRVLEDGPAARANAG